MRGDFHLHTVYSDGVYTVDEILKLATEAGLTVISITDHDGIAGSLEAKRKETGNLKILVGCELSTERHDESIHVLGYFSDLSIIEEFESELVAQRHMRLQRAYNIGIRLQNFFGITLDMSFADQYPSVTRGTIANQIIAQGYPYTKEEIFRTMIGRGCPAYIKSTKTTTKDGIDLIHRCLGKAVIAHPILYKKSRIEDLIALGADGIEAVYRHIDDPDNKTLIELGEKHNLAITAGSDFHSFDDESHGNIGDAYLEGERLRRFLTKMELL